MRRTIAQTGSRKPPPDNRAGSMGPAAWTLALGSLIFGGLLHEAGGQDTGGGSIAASQVAATAGDFTILNGFLVFFMQIGFITLEVGQGRAKNVRNILLKNIVDVMLAALCWWAVGYAFAYGKTAGGFIGTSHFFKDSMSADVKPWFFSWTFAVSCATIVSGCLAERTTFYVYPTIAVLLTSWVHPLVAHWVWHPQGWLLTVTRCRYLDFAGGSVVHCVGGLTGLVGAYFCGPRIGRFEEGEAKTIPGHNMFSVAVGTFMLWFGWFGFNTGSVYVYNGSAGFLADRVALNMTLSACSSGLTVLLVTSFKAGSLELLTCCNGLLTGLVAATGCCAYVPSWGALAIGILAGLSYVPLSNLLLKLKIDDPLDSSVVHFGGGLLGVILNGAFAKPDAVAVLLSKDNVDAACGGFLLDRQDGGMLLGMQLLGAVVICGWTLFSAVLVFGIMSRLPWGIRVDQATELAGIDNIEHGGPAFPEWPAGRTMA